MSAKGRPEILFPLFGDLQKLKGIGPKTLARIAPRLSFEDPRP